MITLYFGDLVYEEDLTELCKFCEFYQGGECKKSVRPERFGINIKCKVGKGISGKSVFLRRFFKEVWRGSNPTQETVIMDEKDVDEKDVIESKEDGIFPRGLYGEGSSDETLYCKKCGSNRFFVGRGEYHISVKCPECGYAVVIYDGW